MQPTTATERPLLYKARFAAPPISGKRATEFLMLPDRIAQWLAANGRANHYVATYANADHLVVVLSNRTTAVLLKLALI
jgi:hypothetical protein